MLPRRLSVNTNEYWHLQWEERLEHLTGHFGFQSLEISMRHDMPDEQFQWLRERLRELQITVTAGHEWYHFFKSNKPEDIRFMQQRFIRAYDGPLTLEAHVPREQCDQTLATSIAFVQRFMD